MKLIIALLTGFCNTGYASELLLPSTEISFEKYSEHCLNTEYVCTTDYFLSLLKKHKTIQFDQMMDVVDLSSAKFTDEFRNKIINILNTEDINRMQLTMLIDLLRQTNQQQPSLLFKMIQNELERIQIIIDNSISMGIKPKKNEFAFIFKEVISIEEVKKIRTTILKIPLYILHFASVPIKTNTVDFNHVIRKPLLKGICGKSALTYKIKSVKYCSANIKNTRDLNQSIFTKEHYY